MTAEKTYIAGVDVGSTTVKLVLLDGEDTLVYQNYLRHGAQTQQTLADLLEAAQKATGVQWVRARITGSGAINLSRALQIPFVQEVVAVAQALEHVAPQTDVAIELGGEDAKIIYFTGGLEERMNGVCAGGTGAFIDQMAALLQTDADGLNQAAAEARRSLSHCRPVRGVRQNGYPTPDQRRRDPGGSGCLHLPGCGQPDHLRSGLRETHPGQRGLSRGATAFPAPS